MQFDKVKEAIKSSRQINKHVHKPTVFMNQFRVSP